jgi:hypothetical protein
MTIAYRGTPLTPNDLLHQLAGRHFCVSYFRPDQIAVVDDAAQSLMIDNGAFSAWQKGIVLDREYWALGVSTSSAGCGWPGRPHGR